MFDVSAILTRGQPFADAHRQVWTANGIPDETYQHHQRTKSHSGIFFFIVILHHIMTTAGISSFFVVVFFFGVK